MRPPGRADIIANVDAVTPFRYTTVTWDHADTVLSEPPWARNVPRELFREQSSSDTLRLISGAWILKPLNNDFSVTHEETTGQQYVIRLSEFNADPAIVEIPFQRVLSELPGIGASGAVSATGDYYMTRRVTAGSSWATSLVTAETPVPYLTEHYPIEGMIQGPKNDIEIACQGYVVKFLLPGVSTQNPDNILTFYFGGFIDARGFGKFALAFNGDGTARILEAWDGAWHEHRTWRYARPVDVAGQLQSIAIIPHAPNYIQFSNFAQAPVSTRTSILSEAAFHALHDQDTDSAQSCLIQTNNRGEIDGSPDLFLPTPPTGGGQIMLEVRRDLRIYWQLQRIFYPVSGTVTEHPFMVPFQLGDRHVVQLFPNVWNFTVLTGAALNIQNPDTMASLPIVPEDYTYNGSTVHVAGWQLPGDVNKCQVVATLTNSEPGVRPNSPAFYGYQARRNPHVDTMAGHEISAPVHNVSISGPDTHPDHETATVFIQDTTNALATLRTRGKIPVRIETQYDEADPEKTSILFEGYSGNIEARKRSSASVNFPSSDWHDLQCALIGKWERLQTQMFLDFIDFYDDSTRPGSTATPGSGRPWKVTDAIRFVLWRVGFADNQLDIFDSDIPFFANPAQNNNALAQPNPTLAYADWLITVARDYLNAFLVWDANAGSIGMWRLLRPPQPSTTPVWNFVTTRQPAGRLPHKSGAYGAATTPILDRQSMVEYVVPPEANVLYVIGSPAAFPNLKPGQKPMASFINRKSVNFPGFTDADPTDLDYMPFVREIWYPDPSLDSPDAVCFVGRRIFNLACRGRKFVRFRAELVLLEPDDPVYTVHKQRPLRIPDVVTVEGVPYMVRGCHPTWRKSWMQMAEYECELLRTDLTYG